MTQQIENEFSLCSVPTAGAIRAAASIARQTTAQIGCYSAMLETPTTQREMALLIDSETAAPELLAALQLVANDVRSGSLPTNIQNAIIAAIAKATGGTVTEQASAKGEAVS
jgi:hypothetical protein